MKSATAAALALLAILAGQPARAQSIPDAGFASAIFPQDRPVPRLEPAPPPPPDPAASFFLLPKPGGWVSVTKWLTLSSAVGLGALGFLLNDDGDDLFAQLERRCEADPAACRQFTRSGAYQDPELEKLFQRVLDKDRLARVSLIGAQLTFGVSVLLFIADFQKDSGPGDVPYVPEGEERRLQQSAVPGAIALRYYFQ